MIESKNLQFKLPDYTPPDWTIGDLYHQAWHILKHNKVLWVFGFAVATFAGGININSFSNLSGFFDQDIKPSEIPNIDSAPNVLGATTFDTVSIFLSIFSAETLPFVYALAIEIVLIAIISIVIGVIAGAWSNAALLNAIETATKGSKPTIREASESAFPKVKSFIWLAIVPGLFWFTVFVIPFGLAGLGFVATSSALKIFFAVLAGIVFLASLYAIFYITLSTIWAQRIIVINQSRAKDALFAGYKIARKKKWSMLLLGLVNMTLSGILTAVPLLFMVGLILGGVFALDKNSFLGVSLITLGVIGTVITIIGFLLLGGLMTAFKAIIWSLAYHKIKGKYDKH